MLNCFAHTLPGALVFAKKWSGLHCRHCAATRPVDIL